MRSVALDDNSSRRAPSDRSFGEVISKARDSWTRTRKLKATLLWKFHQTRRVFLIRASLAGGVKAMVNANLMITLSWWSISLAFYLCRCLPQPVICAKGRLYWTKWMRRHPISHRRFLYHSHRTTNNAKRFYVRLAISTSRTSLMYTSRPCDFTYKKAM